MNIGYSIYLGGLKNRAPREHTFFHLLVNQYGIDAVDDGVTVNVYNGTYYENVVVDKTINLTGEDKIITIIDGGGVGDVDYISANWLNISGFTLQ